MASVAAPRSIAMGRRVAPYPADDATVEGPKDSPDRLSFSAGQQRRLSRAEDGDVPASREAEDASFSSPSEAEESASRDGSHGEEPETEEASPRDGPEGEEPGDDETAGAGPACEARHLSAAALVDGGMQELEADSCSVCLEAFSESDPATLTMCNHEFHFQCVLEWAQRKEECPMCWQALQLSDPSSQDLLEVCARERRDRAAAAAALEAQAQMAPLVPQRIVFIRAPSTRAGPLPPSRHRPSSTWGARPAAVWHGHAASPPQARSPAAGRTPPAPAPPARSVSNFFSSDRSSRGRGQAAGAQRSASGSAQPGPGGSGAAQASQGLPSAASADAVSFRFWRSSKSTPLSSTSSEGGGVLAPAAAAVGVSNVPRRSSSGEASAPTGTSTEGAALVLETAPVASTLSSSSRSSLSPPLSRASSPASQQAHGEEGSTLSTDGSAAGAPDAQALAAAPGKQQNAATPSSSATSTSSAALQGSTSARSATPPSPAPAASWRTRFSLRSGR